MSRNGTGTYNLPAGNPVVTGTTISTTWANTTLTDIATALTGSVAADGQTPITGSLNLNSNTIVNLANPSANQDAATKVYVDTADGLALLKASNLSDVANATTSRTNLSAAKSGANSDITSITGLTTALTASQGGTGAATLTANAVLLGNGTSAIQTVAPSTSGNVLTSNGTTWVSSTPNYVGPQVQAFTSSGTFTVPTGITAVKVSAIGGGGGGGAVVAGSAGGNSSFASSVVGGGGSGGGRGFDNSIECVTDGPNGGGTSVNVPYELTVLRLKGTYGSAGGGGTGSSGCVGASGQNGADRGGVGFVTGLTSGASITITVGAGGAGASGATAGTAGVVVVEW